MNPVRFIDKEHENFYMSMLSRGGSKDAYHRAFFYTAGIADETRDTFTICLILPIIAPSRKVWRNPGKLAAPVAYADWRLIYGTGGRRTERNGCPLLMNCLIAHTRLIF